MSDDDRWYERLGDRSVCPECGDELVALRAPRCPGCGLWLEKRCFVQPGYSAAMNALNLFCVFGPYAVAVVASWVFTAPGVSAQARTLMVGVFVMTWMLGPLIGLVTVPWREGYSDAGLYTRWWRVVLLLVFPLGALAVLIWH